MAGASLDFNLSDLTSWIEKLQARLADLTPLMADIGDSLLTSSMHRFETKTAPDGSAWAALAAATIRDRIRRDYGGENILQRSSALKLSLNSRPGPDQVIVSMGGSGNSTAYARIHQYGGQAGRGHKVKIKARSVLGLSPDDEKSIGVITERFLRESVEGE